MNLRSLRFIVVIMMLLSDGIVGKNCIWGQEITPLEIKEVSSKISEYIDELVDIEGQISRADSKKIGSLERNLETVNFRWNAYMETEQLIIVQDQYLMDAMSAYQERFLSVSDSLASRKVQLTSFSDFKSSEAFLSQVGKEYERLSGEAFKLSLVKQTAPQLAKLKVEEQVLYQKVQQEYQNAREAAAMNPSLSKRMKVLEDKMADYMMESENIQAMEYKPLVSRIKDYLISLAAVAMILMFLSTVKSKAAAIKAQKEAAKKLKESLHDEEYPVI